MNKKNKILTIVISAIVIIGLILIATINTSKTGYATLPEESLQEINVRLPIPVQDSMFAQFYVAQELGFYAEEGLKVNYNLGSSELNPVKMLLSGKDDFAILGGIDAFLVAKGKNLPIKAIAVLNENFNMFTIITLKESGITSIEQLDGKKIGFNYGHISTDILRSVFNQEGITVQEVDVGFNVNTLLSGQVDAMWAAKTTQVMSLESQGISLNTINPEDYGVEVHGYTLFVREDFLEQNSEIIEKFWRATEKSIKYTYQNPEEALEIFMKRAPDLNKDLEYKKLFIYEKTTSFDPVGKMTEEMFKETYDRLNSLGLIENQFDILESYTTRFLGN